ncbi:type IV pilin protein [Elongatibacter sediminis]
MNRRTERGIKHGRRQRGMTMIELMIVLVVIAILIALAYPSYVDYVRKARRGEAQQLLLNWAINQEIFRSNNTTYAADNNANLPKPDHANYNFSTPATPTATAYQLQAVAQGDQAKDKTRDGTSCTTLTINQAGTKTPAGCWD